MSFDRNRRPHLFLSGVAKAIGYTRPPTRGPEPSYPARDFAAHGARLQGELDGLRRSLSRVQVEKLSGSSGLVRGGFVSVDLTVGPGLNLESLEDANSGASLAVVKERAPGETTAVVALPMADLEFLSRKVDAYLDDSKVTKKSKRANEGLINRIDRFRDPCLEDFCLDLPVLPAVQSRTRWEAWLEPRSDGRPLQDELEFAGLRPLRRVLRFPDREVHLVRATLDELREALRKLDSLRELRSPSTIRDFMRMRRREQQEWLDDLALPEQDTPSQGSAVAVCILDTGVDASHPLLRPAFEGSPRVAYSRGWGVDDHHGHGTSMAGLCRHADLLEAILTSGESDPFQYFLESGKILPPSDQNQVRLYGGVTQAVVAQVELEAPSRKRVFSLAVTAEESRDGAPTSWSAAMDQLASGTGETGGVARLIACAAGNVNPEDAGYSYCETNEVQPPEDPAQSWNVLTVGACTNLCELQDPRWTGWTPLSPEGDLSACSRTGLSWSRQWPNKPDLCLEGGNHARSRSGQIGLPDEMSLLTTDRTNEGGLLTCTRDTSAATALCASMAARILSTYDDAEIWPETLRALLVHSARWTPAMTSRRAWMSRSDRARNLLRMYGYGVPDLQRALYSGHSALTMIAQETLQPFVRVGSTIKTREMHLYDLPWPDGTLELLGDAEVRMRVTLSYFIEPAPGRRSFTKRHQYASHSLRFAVRTANESMETFRERINKQERDPEAATSYASDSQEWLLGEERNRGSIHSDVWTGTAADLGGKGAVAVYPVRGWWAENRKLERYDAPARYSLVLSLETDAQTVQVEGGLVAVDLYQEVAQKIELIQSVET